MPIPRALQDRLDDLSFYPDRAERIQALIEIAEGYRPDLHQEIPRTTTNKIPGCESEVFFLVTENADGSKSYRYAVDNPQGISAMALAMMLESVSGSPSKEVAEIKDDVVFEIFGRELSMGKNLGLTNMVKVLRNAASR